MGGVLITGCSSGFGRLSALTLARRGERVYATMRTPSDGESLVSVAQAEDLPLTVRALDVADPASVDAAVEEILGAGEIDALVNNAGQRGPRGPVTTFSDAEMQAVLDVNLFGILRMIRAVAPSMIARGSGTIVNVSSMAGLVGAPFESAYCVSKHAVEALSEALRWELSAAGVRVALIEPGAFETEFFGRDVEPEAFGPDHPERASFDRFSAAIERTMIDGRLQDPQEVADAICSAILDPDDEFRRIVGRDASAIVTLKRERSYGEFEQLIRSMFGLDEPSPVAAGK
jgi:NAD(P)-dependent dehydrogenase (short-subunit alcohol dehydrogenase family)